MISIPSVPALLELGNGMHTVSPSAKVPETVDSPSIPVNSSPAREIQLSISSEDSAVISDVADDDSGDSRGESSDDRVSGDASPDGTAEEEVETPEEVSSESSEEVSDQSSEKVSNQPSNQPSMEVSNQPSNQPSMEVSKEITKDTPKKRRSVSKDWHRRAGRSSKATPAFLSHPNGPFSVYFEPQIDRRTQFSLS